jgi:translation initiation factor IF-1
MEVEVRVAAAEGAGQNPAAGDAEHTSLARIAGRRDANLLLVRGDVVLHKLQHVPACRVRRRLPLGLLE